MLTICYSENTVIHPFIQTIIQGSISLFSWSTCVHVHRSRCSEYNLHFSKNHGRSLTQSQFICTSSDVNLVLDVSIYVVSVTRIKKSIQEHLLVANSLSNAYQLNRQYSCNSESKTIDSDPVTRNTIKCLRSFNQIRNYIISPNDIDK